MLVIVLAFVPAAVAAQDKAESTDAEDQAPSVVWSRALAPDLALALARATQAACRERDFQVSVAIVDRGGAPQVVLRDQLAGNFTFDVAVLKARTAAGFRQPTLDLAAVLADRPELQALDRQDEVLFVGGGVPVEHEGMVIGAVGVSGAPDPAADHACAEAGIEAIGDKLWF